MAVGANTYGSVAGVQALVGDLVASRTFSGSTTPTLTQVEGVLDDVAADINRELEAAGYTVKVSQASYPTAYAFLAAANNYGAAAIVLGMLPPVTFTADTEQEGPSRAQMYQGRLNHALKVITEGKLKAARDTGRLERCYSGASEDADGNDKVPLFTRDQWDYPGSRSLIDE